MRAAAGQSTVDPRQARFWQSLGSGFVRLASRVEVDGWDSIPKHGPVLLAMNHCSLWDGPLLCGLTDRVVACLVKAEVFRPGLGTLLRHAGQIPVHRDVIDPRPVHACLRILRAGGVVGIFPEGTRGAGRVTTVKPGVGYLALRSGATVIPIAGHGSARILRDRRPVVTVSVGRAIEFERTPDSRPMNRREAIRASEVVRVAMAELAGIEPRLHM